MEKLSRVAKRKRLSSCTSEGVRARIVKKPDYDSTPTCFDDLKDNLLVEIFVKLPAKNLHRCKSVSKRWLAFISSSSFVRSFIRLSDVPATKMLLSELRVPGRPCLRQVYVIPLLHDHLVDHSSLPSFIDYIPPLNPLTVTDRQLMLSQLVCTYGGLVLLQAEFQHWTLSHKKNPKRYYRCNYYVCNPITKQWVELPQTGISDRVGFTCYYLQQARGVEGGGSRIWADVASYDNLIKQNANFDPNKIEFTVVTIKINEEARAFVIHVLSSADKVGRWNLRRVPFPLGWTSTGRYSTTMVVFANGKFHWCGKNCIAAYDPFCKPLQCDLIPFPAMDPLDIDVADFSLILTAFEGSLRLVMKSSKCKRLVAWDLVDYANKVWVKNVDVRYCDQDCPQRFESFVGAEDAAKDKAYFLDSPGTIMLFDVKNKSFQHLYHHSNLEKDTSMQSVESFISSPWPTPVPQLKKRK